MKTNRVVLLCLLLGSAAAFGQDYRATITGVVADRSGSVIPHATIRVTNKSTNQSTEVQTTSAGSYSVPYLYPGTYSVEASAPNFQTFRRDNIVLQVNENLNIPFTLDVGSTSQSITVTGGQELIETQNADRGLVFDPIKTQELPLNGRQSYMLMAITPGVIFTQQQFGANGFSGTRGWDANGSYRINGGRSGVNQFLLNGAPISVDGSWQLAVNVEAIQEFKVQTSTYDSQYGRTAGGTVNTILKSGSNNWHGDVFEYWRNSVFDANTIQNNAGGAPKGKHNQHQFGGFLGGPIRRDKDFLFLSFEGWKEVVPFPIQTSTPPVDIRDGQHFSEYGIKIYDPTTSAPCKPSDKCPSGTNYVRQPFAGNVIPVTRISPIGQKILSLYPAPNFTGGNATALQNNFLQPQNSGRYEYHQPIGRYDHIFNDKTRIYGIITYQHGHEFRNTNGFDPPAQRGNIRWERTDQNYIFDFNRVLTASTVFDLRASFGRFTLVGPDGEDDFKFLYTDLGIKNMPTPPTIDRKTAPQISLQNYPNIIANSFTWSTQNQWDLSPNFTYVRGHQTWHYGFEWALIGRGNGGPGNANGVLNFDSNSWTRQFDGRSQGQSDGAGIASLLLGIPNSGSIDYNDTFYRKNQYYAWYFQDDWKVARRLTLNLGLRYEIQRPFTELHNRANAGFDYNAVSPISSPLLQAWNADKTAWDAAHPGNPYPAAPSVIVGGKQFAGVNGQPRRPYDTDFTLIQPRIGFAYLLFPKTVIRGGFGVYHLWKSNTNVADGFNQTTNYVNSLDGRFPSGGLTGPYSLENPFPNGYQTPLGSAGGLATNLGNSVGFDTRQLLIPRTYEASLAIQQEFPGKMVVEAAYTLNRTVHDQVTANLGYLSGDLLTDAQKNPNKYTQQVPNPFYGIVPSTAGFGGSQTIAAANLYSPWPQFGDINQFTNFWGRYRYDSLQISLQKRFLGDRSRSGALTFIFGYTFSKSYEENHFLGLQNPNIGNYYVPGVTKPIKELDYQDVPQSITFAGVYDLPVGRNRHFLANSRKLVDAFVGGWSLDWIWTYYSGFPTGQPNAIFGPVGNTPASACASYVVPNQNFQSWFNNYNGKVTPTNPNGWNCYSDYPSFTLRQVPDRFNWIRNPAEPQLNLGIQKTFRITERYSALIRGEAFNLANTPIRPGPNTDWTSTAFGTVPLQQNNFPRLIQLAAKFMF